MRSYLACCLLASLFLPNLNAESLNKTNDEEIASLDGSILAVIFNNGLQWGWRSASYGCMDCDFEDLTRKRSVSRSSIFAQVAPWAAFILESDLPFSGASVLDVWVKGTALNNGAFYLEDTINRRQSRDLTLDSAVAGDAKVLFGPDNDGWYHMQINLAKLSSAGDSKMLSSFPSLWNRIVIRDKSGSGFVLQLDDAYTFPSVLSVFEVSEVSNIRPASSDGFPCIGTACKALPGSIQSADDMVPLYGGELSINELTPDNGFIMRLKPNATVDEVQSICRELAGESNNTMSRFSGACSDTFGADFGVDSVEEANPTVDWSFTSFTVNSEDDLTQMRRTLGGSVAYFERDRVATIDLVRAVELPETVGIDASNIPWGLDRIDQNSLPLSGGYSPGLDGRDVHIYILDTGIRASQQDFRGRLGDSVSTASGAVVAMLQNNLLDCDLDSKNCTTAVIERFAANDVQGHGTHVSGIAAGSIHGVAKAAIVHAVKVMGDDGTGSYSNIIAGMNWVRDHVKRNGWRGVVNMSLGGPRSNALNDAAEQLVAAGIPVVTSAGNKYGADSCSQSPASSPSSIGVASSTNQDLLSSFSNIGRCVDIFGPGSSIISAGINSDASEAIMSGTSMASPHVAGAVALVLQAYPQATVDEVRNILFNAAANVYFSSSCPPRLLQVQKSKLAPQFNPTAPGSSTPSPTSPPKNSSPAPTAPVPVTRLSKLTVGYS